MMEYTYKQVITGVTIPIEKVRIINELCETMYKTLLPQGTLRVEQKQVCEELSKLIEESK